MTTGEFAKIAEFMGWLLSNALFNYRTKEQFKKLPWRK